MKLKHRLPGLRLAMRLIPTLSFLVMNVCFSPRSVKMKLNIFKVCSICLHLCQYKLVP